MYSPSAIPKRLKTMFDFSSVQPDRNTILTQQAAQVAGWRDQEEHTCQARSLTTAAPHSRVATQRWVTTFQMATFLSQPAVATCTSARFALTHCFNVPLTAKHTA